MSVAPSFQNFEMLCDPFESNGKMYIRVKNPKTGTERQVRWYDEKSKPVKSAAAPVINRPVGEKPQKDILGFTNGYITIFKGDTYKHIDWFRMSIARYTRYWGWYIVSTDEIPADLPEDLEPIRLNWELVGDENGFLYPEEKVKEAADSIIYDCGNSKFVGSIGDRLDIIVKVTKNIELDSEFSSSNLHVMEDADGNIYVWTTSSKNWAEGSEKHIKGTVKSHKKYKNQCQTILNRCLEVK